MKNKTNRDCEIDNIIVKYERRVKRCATNGFVTTMLYIKTVSARYDHK